MDPAQSQERRRLPFLSLLAGLVGFTAASVEILNFFEVRPKNVSHLVTSVRQSLVPVPAASSAPAAAPRETEPAPVPRPTQLVVILENTGDQGAMGEVIRVAAELATRLIPEDTVSLITFVDHKHVWVLSDEPGQLAREQIPRRARGLFPIARVSRRSAVEDALRHLEQDPRPGLSPAVVVLSREAGAGDTLRRWFERIRTRLESRPLVLDAAGHPDVGSR